MDNDWASDGEDELGLGDISSIPDVKIPENLQKPAEPQKPIPQPNAWTTNPSNDVRNALRRPHSQLRPQQPPPARQLRRDAFKDTPPAADRPDASGLRPGSRPTPRSNPRPNSAPNYSRASTLYVTNLPYDTSEGAIGTFFETQGVGVANVRITRHSDTGNIKAAFVQLPPEQDKEQALEVDGRSFGSRKIHVKFDGTDGNRRRDRGGSLSSISYGGAFGARERRDESSNGWGGAAWGDRSSASADPVDRRVRDPRDDRRRDSSNSTDPSIPTGPPPAGRKKLQLKPRTKPLPVLDVDRRAIDPPIAPSSAPPGMGLDGDRSLNRKGLTGRRMPSLDGEKAGGSNDIERPQSQGEQQTTEDSTETWTAAKETGAARQAAANPSVGNKKDDDSKRPLLLNTFAALEVNDSDA